MNNNVMNIIKGFPTPPKDYYKVYVRTCTYNQSVYIEDCLNGGAIQETDFPFVHHVIDDASTDGEQEIIKSWMNRECDEDNAKYYDNDVCTITIAKHRKNPNYTIVAYFLKRNMYNNPGKSLLYKPWQDVCLYFALCEGDDYWTSPKKLQKQYGLLEAHPEYSLCHHNHLILHDGRLTERNENIPHEQDLLSIAENNTVHTLTMFYRNIGQPVVPQDFPFKYPVYQFFMNLRLAEFGKIVYIDEPMAVYRVNEGGIFSMKSLRRQYTMSIGNVINMIDWYTKGKKRPDVVKVLKKKARIMSKSYMKIAKDNSSLSDFFYFARKSLRFWL